MLGNKEQQQYEDLIKERFANSTNNTNTKGTRGGNGNGMKHLKQLPRFSPPSNYDHESSFVKHYFKSASTSNTLGMGGNDESELGIDSRLGNSKYGISTGVFGPSKDAKETVLKNAFLKKMKIST